MLLVDIVNTPLGTVMMIGVVILIVMTIYYTKSCLHKHRKGGPMDDQSTFIEGCCLVAVTVIMADGAEFGGTAIAMAVAGVLVLALLRAVDKLAKLWVERHPQQD